MELTDIDKKHSLTDDSDIIRLIHQVRKGIDYANFFRFSEKSSFNLNEWGLFLNLSERTMQRYKKENKTFDPIHSEKIMEIALLFAKGKSVFGSSDALNTWLNTLSIALGNIKPKELLDSSFGIGMLNDELTRIEHGILA